MSQMSTRVRWSSAEKSPQGEKTWQQGGVGIQVESGGKGKREASDNISRFLAWPGKESNI